MIVETEAYHDSEPACHAHVGLTARTHVLFGPPARAYVYRSYGIHALFNAVCEPEGVGAAVLIRALEPLEGLELMRARRGLERREDLCSGPGKLTQALGIELELNGSDLVRGPIAIEPPPAGLGADRADRGPADRDHQGGGAAVALLRGRLRARCRGRGLRGCGTRWRRGRWLSVNCAGRECGQGLAHARVPPERHGAPRCRPDAQRRDRSGRAAVHRRAVSPFSGASALGAPAGPGLGRLLGRGRRVAGSGSASRRRRRPRALVRSCSGADGVAGATVGAAWTGATPSTASSSSCPRARPAGRS